jgi:DNA-binding PadR family transcriptional regulator
MDAKSPQMTTQTLGVLGALKASCDLSGAEIARITNLKSGTLYPILFRLERANWLESRWEAGDPSQLGRPRRRLYQLTGLGERNARAAFKDASKMIGGLVWEIS